MEPRTCLNVVPENKSTSVHVRLCLGVCFEPMRMSWRHVIVNTRRVTVEQEIINVHDVFEI